MQWKKVILLNTVLCVCVSGCISYSRKGPGFTQTMAKTQTVAVMPVNVKVYQLTAGGIRELIDEWTDSAKATIAESLRQHLGERADVEVKYVDEDWLKENYKDLWNDYRALYEAAATAAFMHGLKQGVNVFPTKTEVFDYTLGSGAAELAEITGADALIFVYGYDHEATAGRNILAFWGAVAGAFTGVYIVPTNPSLMTIGLINGQTGAVEWFNTTPPMNEYSFRKERHLDNIVEWLTRDFIKDD